MFQIYYFFLDTLTLLKSDAKTPVPVLNTGIAWPSDKQMKFKNPPNSNNNLSEGMLKLNLRHVFKIKLFSLIAFFSGGNSL